MGNNLCLISECECRSVRHGAYRDTRYQERYAIYRIAVVNSNIIPFLKESLKDKKIIYIKHDDIAKEMDECSNHDSSPIEYFQKRSFATIYRSLRYVLRPYNLLVSMGEQKNGNKLLVIQNIDKGIDGKLITN